MIILSDGEPIHEAEMDDVIACFSEDNRPDLALRFSM